MGANMVRRLMRGGHQCVVWDQNHANVEKLAGEGAPGGPALDDFLKALQPPRAIWLMVPSAAVDGTLVELSARMEKGDIVIDGGNSYYIDDIRRAKELGGKGLHYVDVGTSGGAAEEGYLYCGPSGAGHFVKMVHNGIEYGLMAAYAEGLNILKHANAGKSSRSADAETAPMRNPEDYQYDLNLADIAEVWRRGSVVASWLLDLTAIALFEQSDLAGFSGHVSDSGEGRWTITAAIDESTPAPVLSAALYQRFSSRGEEDFADKLLSAMRYQFGGHVERKAGS